MKETDIPICEQEEQQAEPVAESDSSVAAEPNQPTTDVSECEKEFTEQLLRIKAEFDNYRKRTAKEKEKIYGDAVGDTVAALLPAIDNLERAHKTAVESNQNDSLTEGVGKVIKQFLTIFSQLGVSQIQAVGQPFDHDLHNAIAHMEDDSVQQNMVVEEFQKGYIKDQRVLRHSVVKVAN